MLKKFFHTTPKLATAKNLATYKLRKEKIFFHTHPKFFLTCPKLVVRMVRGRCAFVELVQPPGVRAGVFLVLRIDSAQLPARGCLREEWRDEELGEAGGYGLDWSH